MKVFHGSPSIDIDSFNLDNIRYQSLEGLGVYFTPDYRVARKYAGSEGAVYLCSFKSSYILDATSIDSFDELFENIKAHLKIDIVKNKNFKVFLKNLTSGQYQISNHNNEGLTSHILRILKKDESIDSDFLDEQESVLNEIVDDFLNGYSIIKYLDTNKEIVFICKKPELIKIEKVIVVGSDDDINYL